jgi:hypothetical protein
VNSYSSRIRLAEMTITNIQEIVDYLIWWIRSVDEEEFIMSYPLLDELLSVILCLVQSNDPFDVPLSKDYTVLFRSKA